MRGRLRALLPRLHLLPPLTRTLVAVGDELLAAALADATADDDVIVIAESAEALERLRAQVAAANVSFLLGIDGVLPLPDHSVDALLGDAAAEERERVTRP